MELGTIRKVDIDREVQQAYLDYAMSVIVARALPDARDGLKPVQRRILYAMHDMRLAPGTAFKKSARIVGEVLGKYHPHGDMAVYEAMARMAQDFSMRYLLVQGQGNFGSVDGDPPAAMRYTESRLAPVATELLADLERETVGFQVNFDGTLREPEVLPAAAPNMLVNGATGIAVGMATSIPPHNMGEVCDALIFMLRSWSRVDDISIEELLRFIQGPDFPTGGLILDRAGSEEGLSAAYGSGRGKVLVRARAHVEGMERGRTRLLVTELPYQVNKAGLLERIAELVRQGALEGVADLRDESDRQGMRIVIELSRTADPRKVLRELYKRTPMETTFSIILLALVRGEPRMLSLKQALRVFLDHRLEVIRKRSLFDLARAKERAHLLEGLRIALKNLEEVIRLIRAAKDADEARARLQKRFKLSEVQATAILDMPLRRLAALEREKIELEYKEKLAQIKGLERLLASPKLMREVLAQDLARVKAAYNDPRRSAIVRGWEEPASMPLTVEETLPSQHVWVTLTAEGLLSRTEDTKRALALPHIAPRFVLEANTRDTLLLVTEKGRAAALNVHALPARARAEQGAPFHTLCALDAPSRVVAGVALPSSAAADNGFLVIATRRGMVKKTALADLPGPSAQVLTLIKMAANDGLASAFLTQGDEDVLMVTSQGMAIRFREREVRPMGLNAAGVLGMKLGRAEEQVVAAQPVLPRSDVLLVAQSGRAKRTPLAQYPVQGRHGVGALTWKLARKEALVGALVGDADTRFILAFNDGLGKLARLKDASRRARLSAGGVLVKLKKGQSLQRVVAISTERELRAPAAKKRKAKAPGKTGKPAAATSKRAAAAGKASARAKEARRGKRPARRKS